MHQLHLETDERDLILYSTAFTVDGATSTPINSADVHAFMDVIHGLDGDELDLVVHSPGGSPSATEQIVTYLRSKYDDIRVFVPQSAMSAATLLCCAADTVVMGRHSSLGPIDPQLNLPTTPAGHTTAAVSVLDQFEMARKSINTNSDLLSWMPILQQYGPGLLAKCEESIDLSHELAKDWVERYMYSGQQNSQKKGEEVADFLSNRRDFKSHSRPIDKEEAQQNGFKITDLEGDQDLQDCVLSVFHAATLAHMNTNAVKIVENHLGENTIEVSSSRGNRDGNTG